MFVSFTELSGVAGLVPPCDYLRGKVSTCLVGLLSSIELKHS